MHVSTSDAAAHHRAPPSSPEANKTFFLLRHTGRMARSTTFVSGMFRPRHP
jgi:hypothetical protein